ncbi:ABC transporter ATP-binding protein [Streptomyces sp. NPDC004788]
MRDRGGGRLTGPREILRVLRGHRRWIVGAVSLTVLASALGLAQPLVVRRVIESAGAGAAVAGPVALLVVLFLAQALVQAVAGYVLARTGEGVVLGIRLDLVEHLLRLPMRTYDRYRTGDLIARTSADSTALRLLIAEGFTDAVSGVVGLAGVAVLMIWLDWFLFLIVLALIALGGLLVASVLRGIARASLRAQRATGAMTAELERALGAIRTVRASRAERREADRIGAQAEAAFSASVRVGRLDAVVAPAIELTVQGSFLLVLLIGGVRVADQGTSVADLAAFLLYMLFLVGPVGAVFQAVSTLQQGAGALRRITEILDLPSEPEAVPEAPDVVRRSPAAVHGNPNAVRRSPEVVHGSPETVQRSPAVGRGSPAVVRGSPAVVRGSPAAGSEAPAAVSSAPSPRPGHRPPVLEFQDVWFGYDPGRPVLRGVSFRVPAQGHVALVGSSGAGKSTVFALAERFYDPDRGVLLFEGRDVRTLSRAEHRARIGLVEQHAPVLYGTLRENLLYAAPEAGAEEVGRAVELAQLSELVARLPRGLDTDAGEHGMALSGGERQRVAIARSLLSRPGLLLLDEPTAHLDAVNEAALRRSIEQAAAECAVLVIAHRLSTIRAADLIIVLDGGRVAATGSHEDLLDRCAPYRLLCRAQQTKRPAAHGGGNR